MQPEHWARVKALFEAALEQPAETREALLDEACAGDAALRREVESLLAYADADGPLGPATDLAAAPAESLDANFGRRLGAYRIIRELGRGGMGAVYLAERVDGQFEHQVALKVVQRSAADRDLERRFRVERQVLASLEHPHIARLLDGGVAETGEPFFVMEYVAGEPLIAFAGRAKLGIRPRLEIFRKVCSAVSYAHAKLVVHRDLKPSNILVPPDAEPKLIDFGLAKVLETTGSDDGAKNLTVFRAFTPAYASPEQVRGQPITTATDVYSLGVVLYELLTGRKPFDVGAGGVVDLLRTLETTDAVRPSLALTRRARDGDAELDGPPYRGTQLEGDLDNIVLTALRREPERRYPSVAALAEDVQRYLDGRPVSAHPSSLGYRAAKFVRRNAVPVAASALAVCAVAGGLTIALVEGRVAREQRDRATRRFEDVRRLSNSLLFELSPRIERLPGATSARDLLVRRALEYLDSLANEAADDRGLQMELAAAYEKIGDLEGNPTNPNLIEYDAAIASYRKARRIRQPVTGADGPTAERALAENFRVLGNIYSQANEFELAARDLDEARRLYERALARTPADPALRLALAQTMHDLGRHQSNSSRYAAALVPLQQAIAIADRLRKDAPAAPDVLRLLAETRAQYGLALSWEGRQSEAEAEMQQAAAIYEPLAAAHPNDVTLRNGLWSVYWLTSSVYEEQDDVRSHAFAQQALAAIRPAVEQDRDNIRARQQLAKSYSRLGQTAMNLGRAEASITHLQQACAILDGIAASESRNGRLRSELALALTRLADAQAARSHLEAALASADRAAAIYADLLVRFPKDRRSVRNVVLTHQAIGDIHERLMRAEPASAPAHRARAAASYRRALDLVLSLRANAHLAESDQKLVKALQVKVSVHDGGPQ
jgi:non-specific serine/threonine protein kinase/serine/threonine-protein kinase